MAIITIGGNVGAGKTTLAKNLAGKLGYEELYVGAIFREIAAERGISIEQLYTELKNDPSVDRAIDEWQKNLMREKDNLIVQGRVAWFLAKGSPFHVFNILLTVDPAMGAERVGQRPEHAGESIAKLREINQERVGVELERYRMLYAIDNFLDPRYYDFVLDTSGLTEDEVLGKILEQLQLS